MPCRAAFTAIRRIGAIRAIDFERADKARPVVLPPDKHFKDAAKEALVVQTGKEHVTV